MSHLMPIDLIYITAISGALSFYNGCKSYISNRKLKKTPICKLAGAAEGYIQVNGRADSTENSILRAPLSGKECCAYEIAIKSKSEDSWYTIDNIKSKNKILLQDKDGYKCYIDTPEASLETKQSNRSSYYRMERKIDLQNPENNSTKNKNIIIRIVERLLPNYYFIETIIPADTELFVSGYYHLEDNTNTSSNDNNIASYPARKNLGCITSKRQSINDQPQSLLNSTDNKYK